MKISSFIVFTFAVSTEAIGRRRLQDGDESSWLESFMNCVQSDNGETSLEKYTMTQEKIEDAQKAWGDGIVAISSAYTEDPSTDTYKKLAEDHLDNLYAYGITPVLFKPTLASEHQFRPTYNEALSYFVKGMYPEDTGFAIKGWTDVRFENDGGIVTEGPVGSAMGNYFFTTPDGDEVKVEYSFGYIHDEDGNVKINLHHSSLPYDIPITEEQVRDAQKAWGEGIVKISSAYTDGGDYKKEAEDLINTLYGYDDFSVLFKPTLAAEHQFRPTFDDALSYFIGGKYDEDTGFAIKGWQNVRFESEGVQLEDQVASDMGNYFFTDPNGEEVKVEYSFGYKLDDQGEPRIVLHHSSLPYEP